jgi:hypothetical protein
LQPEIGLQIENKQKNRILNVNRFQLMSRLAQYIMLDYISASQDSQLDYQLKNQNYISGSGINNTSMITNNNNQNDTGYDGYTNFNYNINRADDYVHGNNYNSIDDQVIDQGRITQNKSSATFLSGSISGSPKHRKLAAHNALQLINKLGKIKVKKYYFDFIYYFYFLIR